MGSRPAANGASEPPGILQRGPSTTSDRPDAPHDLSRPCDDVSLAAALAAGAGDVLLVSSPRPTPTDPTASPSRPARRAGQGRRRRRPGLARGRPGRRPARDAVLSEEGADDAVRLTADGSGSSTRSTAPASSPSDRRAGDDWAVHVALWERRRARRRAPSPCPAHGPVLSTGDARRCRAAAAAGAPAADRRQPLPAARGSPTLARRASATSSSSRWARPASRSSAVLDGRVDAYVHGGGQYEWDSAAPVAVARAAGFWRDPRSTARRSCTTAENPWLPDLVVCAPRDCWDTGRGACRRSATPRRTLAR